MKKILSLILVLCMVSVVLPMSVSAANANGTVGSCVWKLEGTKLTISGNGSTGITPNRSPWGTAITDLVVEEGVTDLYVRMFEKCTKLRNVKLPSTLKTINHSVFADCTSLTSIDIPDGVVTMGASVFYNCTSLVEVNISKTVSSIDHETFTDCYSLVSINVDENNPYLTSVGGVLFNKNMTKLIKYPQNKSGMSYTVPESVKVIDYKAFEGNWCLLNVRLHDNITRIGADAFHSTNMYYSTSNHYKGGFYLGNYMIAQIDDKIANFSVREGTKLIADGAFNSYDIMTTVNIPEGVESIGEGAFSWCSAIERVTIPKSVTYIGGSAFLECKSLKDVYYRGDQSDRSKVFVGASNSSLTNAKWTYNACINSTPHKWGEYVVTKKADCVTDGARERTCLLCKSVQTEPVPATGHSFDVTSQTKAPTCVEAGTKQRICSVCNFVEQSALPPTDHVFGPWGVEIQPTCEGVGVEKRKCSLCAREEARNIEAIGHDYSEFEVVSEATAETEGSEQSVCKNCSDVQTRVIPKLETTSAHQTQPSAPDEPAVDIPADQQGSFGGVGMIIAFAAVVVIAGGVIVGLLVDKLKKKH